MINLLKTTELISSCSQVDTVLPMLFVTGYSFNKTGANTHETIIKLSFSHFFVQFVILKAAK